MSQRWRALQRVMVSPTTIGDIVKSAEDAERECLSAIAFALEGDLHDYDTDAETLTLDVNVAPAA
jgi:hypothetical protein